MTNKSDKRHQERYFSFTFDVFYSSVVTRAGKGEDKERISTIFIQSVEDSYSTIISKTGSGFEYLKKTFWIKEKFLMTPEKQ